MQGMTKNPLALGAGVLLMLFGICLAAFFGYQFFLEEKHYRSQAKSVMGIVTQKEEEKIYAEGLDSDGSAAGSKKTTGAAAAAAAAAKTATTGSQASAPATTETTERVIMTKLKLHYSFLPAGATDPVTGVYKATERLFKAMKEKESIEVLYMPDKPKEDHRPLFPIKFGSSFYAGVSVLLGGCLFIAYLGWCFIFPEDEPVSSSSSERKKSKKKKKGKK